MVQRNQTTQSHQLVTKFNFATNFRINFKGQFTSPGSQFPWQNKANGSDISKAPKSPTIIREYTIVYVIKC